MLFKTLTCGTTIFTAQAGYLLQTRHMGRLKVKWHKDESIDNTIQAFYRYKPGALVVREILRQPGQKIPLKYIDKLRNKLCLQVSAQTFVNQNPDLFEVYKDRVRPKAKPIPFLRPSQRLRRFCEEEKKIYADNEAFIASKLCKMLMMSKDRALNTRRLLEVKRYFGFPRDLLTNLVPKHSEKFRLTPGEKGNLFLELVTWIPSLAKSAVEIRSERELELTGVRFRPNFKYELPKQFPFTKGMKEWVWDWLEMEYISPYQDPSRLERSSPEMEKWRVGVFHELLSLTTHKRIALPILGKFWDEFRFSNEFWTTFRRHPGIFYLTQEEGIRTAVLREAYSKNMFVGRDDPLLEIEDKFFKLLEEGWERAEQLRLHRKERVEQLRPHREERAEQLRLQREEGIKLKGK